MYLLILVSLSFLTSGLVGQTIVRQNYGVVYRKLDRQLTHGATLLEFTFSIKLSNYYKIRKPIELATLVPSRSQLERNSPTTLGLLTLAKIEKLDRMTAHEFKLTKRLHGIYDGFSRSRNRHAAILQPIADILRDLIGTATEPEIKSIENQLDEVATMVDSEFSNYREIIGTIYSMADLNYDNIKSEVQSLNLTIATMEYLENSINTLGYNLTNVYDHLVERSYMAEKYSLLLHLGSMQFFILTKYNSKLADLVNQIDALHSGELPKKFIQTDKLELALTYLNETLQTHNSSYYIVNLPLKHYYTESETTLSRMDKNWVHLTLQIPLSLVEIYDLYQVTVLSVPLKPHTVVSDNSYTHLISDKQFIAISGIKKRYFELEGPSFDLCMTNNMYICKTAFPTKLTSNPTCLMAIFDDNIKLVHALCNFKITKHVLILPSMAIPIETDSYLVRTNHPSSMTKCNDKSRIFHNIASYMIMRIPCRCRITTDGIEMLNSDPRCLPSIYDNQVVFYTFNLPLLYHFNAIELNTSGSETSLRRIIFKSEGIDQLHELLTHESLDLFPRAIDLRGIAARLNNRTLHPGRGGLRSFLHSLSTVTSHPLVELLSVTLSILSILVSIYLWRKVAGIWTIFLYGNRAHAFNITSWKSAMKSFAVVKDNYEHIDRSITGIGNDYHEFVGLLVIIMIIYVVKKFISCRYNKPKNSKIVTYDLPFVALKIYQTWDSILIPLVSIKYEPNIFTVISTAPVVDYHLRGCFRGTLDLRWQGKLLLSVNSVTTKVNLPFMVNIPLRQRLAIWKSLHNPQTPQYGIVIVHGTKHHQIPISGAEAECTV